MNNKTHRLSRRKVEKSSWRVMPLMMTTSLAEPVQWISQGYQMSRQTAWWNPQECMNQTATEYQHKLSSSPRSTRNHTETGVTIRRIIITSKSGRIKMQNVREICGNPETFQIRCQTNGSNNIQLTVQNSKINVQLCGCRRLSLGNRSETKLSLQIK